MYDCSSIFCNYKAYAKRHFKRAINIKLAVFIK